MNATKQRLIEIFNNGNVKFKTIDTFGTNVIVTCWSEPVAQKIAAIFKAATFTKVSVAKSVDYNVVNKGGSNRPSIHEVWLVGASII